MSNHAVPNGQHNGQHDSASLTYAWTTVAGASSPDPEGPVQPPQLQQLATTHASSCHPMLEFAASDARLCCGLLAQMSKFAEGLDPGIRASAVPYSGVPRAILTKSAREPALISRHLPIVLSRGLTGPRAHLFVSRIREAISKSRSSVMGPGREEIPRPSVTSCFPPQRLISYWRSEQARGSRSQSQR